MKDTINNYNNNTKEETNTTSEDVKKQAKSFNFMLEYYKGKQTGIFIVSLLDEVVTSNKKNLDHLVTVSYNNKETTDEYEIKSIRDSFDKMSSKEYEISLFANIVG